MKKITTTLILIVFGLGLFSCSKDDDQNSGAGTLKLSGKVMSPNNSFPIPRAKVKVYNGSELIAEKTTDALGAFTVEHLPEGNLTVELSKGKFTREVQVSLHADYELPTTERSLDTFPHMAVVTGYYDAIEDILFNIGIVDPVTGAPAFDIIDGQTGRPSIASRQAHGHGDIVGRSSTLAPNVTFSVSQLLHDTTMLSTYDILFLDCGGNDTVTGDAVAMANLKTFIENGGIVYATDWTYTYIQSMFPANDYMSFSTPEKGGDSLTADVAVTNADLTTWLEGQGITVTPTVQINGFLTAWQMIDTFNPANVDDWVVANSVQYDGVTVNNKALAFTFNYGCGGVFYSSFHTHGNNTSEVTIEQMMDYFIFELSALGNCNNGS
ncbi:MAG TPA: carboxypeptidase-like regulatory domain-containing protein [Flavobacterium sp.]|nr:carboxypeptidase-like regulatory domain-containing protein [Flavobacterium sp.]